MPESSLPTLYVRPAAQVSLVRALRQLRCESVQVWRTFAGEVVQRQHQFSDEQLVSVLGGMYSARYLCSLLPCTTLLGAAAIKRVAFGAHSRWSILSLLPLLLCGLLQISATWGTAMLGCSRRCWDASRGLWRVRGRRTSSRRRCALRPSTRPRS